MYATVVQQCVAIKLYACRNWPRPYWGKRLRSNRVNTTINLVAGKVPRLSYDVYSNMASSAMIVDKELVNLPR